MGVFNKGDSIGIIALCLTGLAMGLTPPLWLKILLIAASAVCLVIFVYRSHWTNNYKVATKAALSFLFTVGLLAVAIPQFMEQWQKEHHHGYFSSAIALKGNISELATELRALQREAHDAENEVMDQEREQIITAKSEDERNRISQRYLKDDLMLRARVEQRFGPLRARASFDLRELQGYGLPKRSYGELERMAKTTLENGQLAGPNPMEDVATYLELVAAELPAER